MDWLEPYTYAFKEIPGVRESEPSSTPDSFPSPSAGLKSSYNEVAVAVIASYVLGLPTGPNQLYVELASVSSSVEVPSFMMISQLTKSDARDCPCSRLS